MQNASMPIDAELRLTDLEIKASYHEDLLDELNKTVFRQQEQIDALIRDLQQLRQQTAADMSGAPNAQRDELPPHY